VFSVSSVETEQYKAMGVAGDRIAMVPHGIEPSDYETLPPKGAFRKRHGIGDEERVILYLGRVHKIKGLDLLARAFVDILRAVPEARLVVAGSDDGYLHTMKKLADDLGIAGRTLFPGPIYERSKLEAYVDADVYVLPSTYEIFGVSALEACACGTPVVLTDRCGVGDHMGGRAGIVVPYEATKVAGAVVDVLRSSDRGKGLGQAGRKLVMEEFGWSKAVDKLEALYAGAARERGT
jgi:glycosyltransferase involved in cell wall biosynthesis